MSNGKMPDLGNLMDLAQKLQGDMAKLQEELASKTSEGSAGGGMVRATVNGHFDLVDLHVDQAVVDPSDVQMLCDLVVAAVNQAVIKMRDETNQQMSKLTGGLPIPGMPKLF